MKHLHFQKAIKRFMPFVPFVVIHFFIRDILLALAIVLNYSYIVNDNLSAIVEIALYVMFTGGVFTWYIKRKGYREFILLKNTTTFVVVFLILIFSLQYLKHTVFESSITKYQLFTLHWRQFDSIVLALNSENQLMIGSVLDTGIFAPVFESILTIGLLQKPLYQKVSSYKAILIAAAVFSLLHWSLEKIPFAFVSGLLYGYLYYKTGKLIYPILAHSFNNLLSTALIYTPQDINLESAITLLVAVTCFAVSLRYVIRYRSSEIEHFHK